MQNRYGVGADGVPLRNPSERLRDHSNGIASSSEDMKIGTDGFDPYWYDLDDKADLGPQVYILPSFGKYPKGAYLDTLWQAMKECPDTTYEGFVIKNEYFPEVYTDKQSDNQSWTRIRYR